MKTLVSFFVALFTLQSNANSIESLVGRRLTLSRAETMWCPSAVTVSRIDSGFAISDFAVFEKINMGWSDWSGDVFRTRTMSYTEGDNVMGRIDQGGNVLANPNSRFYRAALVNSGLHLQFTFSGISKLDCLYSEVK